MFLLSASGKILAALKQDRNLTIPELAALIGVTERSIERNIKKLQEQGRLRRIGPAKGGLWRACQPTKESWQTSMTKLTDEKRNMCISMPITTRAKI
jgi:DeoR/GlpR family transcriptional regulator of sugar metabolism